MKLEREVLPPRLQLTREDVECQRARSKRNADIRVALVWGAIVVGLYHFWLAMWNAL